MAVAITFANGFKVSYSGDCRPSRDLAAIGKGSTVLVHEATFDDEMQGDAIAKKHSTISEAVGVGVEMGARRIILTHFSQRYSKIPTMGDLQGRKVRLERAEAGEDGDETEPIQEPDLSTDAEATSAPNLAGSQNDGQPTQHDTNEDGVEVDLSSPTAHQDHDLKIAVAFDYMRVKVKDIASLEHFTPALRELYKADETTSAADRRRSSHVDGGQSDTLHRVNSERAKGGKGSKPSSVNGKGRQVAAAAATATNSDESKESNPLDERIADLKLGSGLERPYPLIRYGARDSKGRRSYSLQLPTTRTREGSGLVEDRSVAPSVEMSRRELCAP